jgi:hypothetical protein
MPVVLRPDRWDCKVGDTRCRLVGKRYVHRAMEGEGMAWLGLNPEDAEEFTIY